MEQRDRPPDPVDSAECAACGWPVPRNAVRVLARREDLAFAELPCASCGSVSLAIFVGPQTLPPAQDPVDRPAPIGPADVIEMHQLLDAWQGDLRTLVEGSSGGAPGTR